MNTITKIGVVCVNIILILILTYLSFFTSNSLLVIYSVPLILIYTTLYIAKKDRNKEIYNFVIITLTITFLLSPLLHWFISVNYQEVPNKNISKIEYKLKDV